MKYSNILNAKVISEKQGLKIPRLVQYTNQSELDTKRNFLEWDILNATSVRLLVDAIMQTNNDQTDGINTLNSQIVQINNTLKNIATTGGASVASAVVYDNSVSKLHALNAQSAIDELNVNITTGVSTLNTGLTTEVNRAKAAEKATNDTIKSIIISGGGASVASAVIYDDDDTKIGSTNAQGVIEIIDSKIKALQTLVDNIKDAGYKIQLLEQTQYDVLTSYDPDTLYFIYEPINYTKVDKPVNRTIVQDGKVYALTSTDAYTVTGTGGSAIGTYTFTVTLKQGYMWSDNTLTNLTITYTIIDKSTGWVFGSVFPIILT